MSNERLKLGQQGERGASQFLESQGYRILQSNYRTKFAELDIIAQEGPIVCFVEVRTKTSGQFGHPFESISGYKIRKLCLAALSYIQANRLDDSIFRFDVVAVLPGETPDNFRFELLKNAFELDESLI